MQNVVLKCGFLAVLSEVIQGSVLGPLFFLVWLHVMQVFPMDPR